MAMCVQDFWPFECPLCRIDLSPGPEQLFEEATRRYFDVHRLLGRGGGVVGRSDQDEVRE